MIAIPYNPEEGMKIMMLGGMYEVSLIIAVLARWFSIGSYRVTFQVILKRPQSKEFQSDEHGACSRNLM
jgi:hypothetical protein